MTKEDREADENGNEEKVGCRGGRGTDEEDPCIGLETSQAREQERGERIHCDDIVPRKHSGERHSNNGSGGG